MIQGQYKGEEPVQTGYSRLDWLWCDGSFIGYPGVKCPSGGITKDSNGGGYRSARMKYF